MKHKKEICLSQWLPLLVTTALAPITLIAYTWMFKERNPVVYLQVLAGALIPAIFPILGKIMKKPLPIIINVLIAVHTVLACNLGSAMQFYWRFPHWDLLLHGYFGFLAGATLYVMLLHWNGAALNGRGFLILIFLGTMGGAALWEIFEYSCDLLLGGDAQRVHEALSLGISPVKDTMTDIIIAVAGLLVFYLSLFADKCFGYRISKRIHRQTACSTS